MRICRLCNQPIMGAETAEVQICGQTIWIGVTVHDHCLEAFQAAEAKRKPYRQPIEVPFGTVKARVETMIQELTETVRDWD